MVAADLDEEDWTSMSASRDGRPASYLRFPPGMRHVLIPTGPPAAAALGMTLYTASRPIPLLMQRALWLLARAGGTRLVPGQRETWVPPMGESTFGRLADAWFTAAGLGTAPVAVYQRPQAFRAGVVCLLCAGARSLVVRVRSDPSELEAEKRISAVATEHGELPFRIPRLLGSGEVDGWHWAGYEVMSQRPHAPARACSDAMLRGIADLVGAVVPRPPGVPDHWRPAHGDLTPWNVRRASGDRPWVIDWEDARWAPPGADLVYFLATSAAIGDRRSAARLAALPDHREAREYWTRIVGGRQVTEKENALTSGLLAALSDAPE
jgi:hypothetical protein